MRTDSNVTPSKTPTIFATRTRYTITRLSRLTFVPAAPAVLILTLLAVEARAQGPPQSPPAGSFADGRWHAEFAVQAALEAWNYNPSHEELYGLIQGVTYGLRDGLVLTVRQRLMYVSQRRNDSRVLGMTAGLRGRIYHRGRASAFLQFDLGVSDAAVAVPPRGTRFNYLALGGGGSPGRSTAASRPSRRLKSSTFRTQALPGPIAIQT